MTAVQHNTDGEDRRAIHAYLSETAHAAWQELSESAGVSITGMLESLGVELAEEMANNPGVDAEDLRKDWVKAGRKVDARRRRRSPDRLVAVS
jgi:hypothetical protein